MYRVVSILALALSALNVLAQEEKHFDPDKLSAEFAEIPINSYWFIGNAIVCKSDTDSEHAWNRIAQFRVGDNYDLQAEPFKEILQPNGVTASVHLIAANEQYEAYWVIGHKEGYIESVQLTGNYPSEQLSFSTIQLTDPEEKVSRILGSAFRVKDVPEINGVIHDYYPFPFSVEFVDQRVYSIRVGYSNNN